MMLAASRGSSAMAGKVKRLARTKNPIKRGAAIMALRGYLRRSGPGSSLCLPRETGCAPQFAVAEVQGVRSAKTNRVLENFSCRLVSFLVREQESATAFAVGFGKQSRSIHEKIREPGKSCAAKRRRMKG